VCFESALRNQGGSPAPGCPAPTPRRVHASTEPPFLFTFPGLCGLGCIRHSIRPLCLIDLVWCKCDPCARDSVGACICRAPVQLQERLRRFQDNVRTLVDEPLKAAEAMFKREKAELNARLAAAEALSAKSQADSRGKSRHIAELEAALEVCNRQG
jgi:hypothetical protein